MLFSAAAGDERAPKDMTLEEVKTLRVEGKEPVATLEEMLDASKGRIKLFVELKGETADTQMADDAVRIIKEHGMEEEAILISLKYDLMNYIESNYPEMQTGYLCFATFGETAALNCDFLGIEEESAIDAVLEDIKQAGKKTLVWTVNNWEDQHSFLQKNAYAIITDEVSMAHDLTEQLEQRSEIQRIVDRIMLMFAAR